NGRLAVYAMSSTYLSFASQNGRVRELSIASAGNLNIVAQQGLLVEHTGDTIDLLEGVPVEQRDLAWKPRPLDAARVDNHLLRITLPWGLAPRLLETLRVQDIHGASVYPGTQGVAALVREVYIEDLTEDTDPTEGDAQ